MCGYFSLCEAWLQAQTSHVAHCLQCFVLAPPSMLIIMCSVQTVKTDEAGFCFHLHLHAIYVLIRLGPFPSHFNPFFTHLQATADIGFSLHFICQTNFTVLSTARKCFASLFTNPVSHDRKWQWKYETLNARRFAYIVWPWPLSF